MIVTSMKNKLFQCTILIVFLFFGKPVFAQDNVVQSPPELENPTISAVTEDATTSKKLIQQKAEDVAKQIEVYLQSHPKMTLKDLQRDPVFQNIAVQTVGDEGYTGIIDSESGYFYFHPQDKLVNTDSHVLKEQLPLFWSIFDDTIGVICSDSSGYYDWKEADGTITQKYLSTKCVQTPTADGKKLFVGVTAYLDKKDATEYIEKYSINNTFAFAKLNIKQKAKDVAKQIEIYISSNPDKTLADLQEDEYFQSIAVQLVGETGYTCVYEAGTGIMRFHPNKEFVNQDMSILKEKLPDWWGLFDDSLKGKEVSGLYKWLESDDSLKDKYMTMTPVRVPFGSTTLMVAATTYLDEYEDKKSNQYSNNFFDAHLDILSDKINSRLENIENDLMFVSELSALHQLINGDNSGKTQLINLIHNFSQNKSIYYQIRYLNEFGQEVIRVDNINNTVAIVPEDKLQNKKGRYYFDDAMQFGENDVYISPLDLNIERGEIENRGTEENPVYVPVIRYGTPVFDKWHNRKGIVLFNIYANTILDILQQEQAKLSGANIYLANSDGYFLFHPDKSKEFGFMFEDDSTLSNEFGGISQEFFTNEQGIIQKNDNEYIYKKIFLSGQNVQHTDNYWVLIFEYSKESNQIGAKDDVFPLNISIILIVLLGLLVYLFFFFSTTTTTTTTNLKGMVLSFKLFIVSAILLLLSNVLNIHTTSLEMGLYLERILYFSAFFFVFSFSLLSTYAAGKQIKKSVLVLLLLLNIAIAYFVIFTNLIIASVRLKESSFPFIKAVNGDLYFFLAVLVFVTLVTPLIFLIKNSSKSKKTIKPFLRVYALLGVIIGINIFFYMILGLDNPYLLLVSTILFTAIVGITLHKIDLLKQKQNTVMILLGIASLVIIGLFVFNTYQVTQTIKNDALESAKDSLTVLADLKAGFVRTFLDEELNKIQIAATHQDITNEELKEITATQRHFSEVFIIDSYGIITNSSNETSIGLNKANSNYFIGARDKQHIGQPYYSETTKTGSVTVSTPFHDGVLAARMDMKTLNEIMNIQAKINKTKETYLINSEGYMITPSSFIENTFLTQKIDTKNARSCLSMRNAGAHDGHEVASTFKDYRGVEVIGAHAYIPETRWCLLAEVDKEEVLASIKKSINKIWLFTIGIITSVILIGIIFNNLFTKTLRKEVTVKTKEINEQLKKEEEATRIQKQMAEERKQAKAETDKANKQLVIEKAEAEKARESAEKMNKLVVGRELKMIELKKEIKRLRQDKVDSK